MLLSTYIEVHNMPMATGGSSSGRNPTRNRRQQQRAQPATCCRRIRNLEFEFGRTVIIILSYTNLVQKLFISIVCTMIPSVHQKLPKAA